MMMSAMGGDADWQQIQKIRSILDDAFGELTADSKVDAS